MFGKIILWAAILLISAGLIAALIVWLAPLIAALVILYIASKIIISRCRVEGRQNYSMRTVDS